MILNKRIFRELRKNFFRYLALFLIVVISMYMVISMAGSAEMVMKGVQENQESSKVEDGQLEVLAPYSEKEIKKIEKFGVQIEECFYMDFDYVDGEDAILRIFQDREKINLVTLDNGVNPKRKNEIVLEKHFAAANHLVVGDTTLIGELEFEVVGIGSSPDYDCTLENLSDIGATPSQFGTAFVSSKGYEALRETNKAIKSETYNYSYLLDENVGQDAFRDFLNEIYVNNDLVSNKYVREMIDEVLDKKAEIKDAIQDLVDGGNDILEGIDEVKDGNVELTDGIKEVTKNSDDIRKATSDAFDGILKNASSQLKQAGLEVSLTQSNYASKLNALLSKIDVEQQKPLYIQVKSLKETLESFQEYQEGVNEYTEAVQTAQEGSESLGEGVDELRDGSVELNDGLLEFQEEMDEFIEENMVVEISNLTYFLSAEDNPRIGSSADDIKINKVGALMVGVIVLILLAYILSVFTIHNIEEESPVIGALYSLGYKRGELLGHYLVLPIIVSLVGGICGTIAGYYGIDAQCEQNFTYFSYPQLPSYFPSYLIVYGVVLPPIVAAIVNTIVIGKKLSLEPLKLLRREKKEVGNKDIDLKNMGFIMRFRIRLFLRELRSSLTLTAGLFVSLLVLMLSVCCFNAVTNIIKETDEDVHFSYLYYYKFPAEEVPEGGEGCYMKTLKSEVLNHNMDVTIMGLQKESAYFDFDVEMKQGKNILYVSSSTADKYELKKGDIFKLTDDVKNVSYEFEVEEIVQYAVGLYVFMDIDTMRDVFEQEEDYYNAVLSNEPLNTENDRLYSVTTGEEIREYSQLFMDLNKSMIVSLIAASTFLFIVVMFLMLKMIIEKQSYNISLFKMFGYNEREVGKLFLGSNFFIVTFSALFCVPLTKYIMCTIYKFLVSNRATGWNLEFSKESYIFIFALIYISYFAVTFALKAKLRKISPNEVLKNRE